MTYRSEFPDFPADAMPAVPNSFYDRSWRNEPCPSFMHDETGLLLQVDYPEASQREFADAPRFRAYRLEAAHPDAGWQIDGDLNAFIETDDWLEAQSALSAALFAD